MGDASVGRCGKAMPQKNDTTDPPLDSRADDPIRRRAYDPLKRWLDLTASAVGLLILAPVLLLAAAAIKLTSRGPVLYRGRRAGRGGVPFDVLKLRTMVEDADRASAITAGVDARITPFGRLLRRTKLDELPQLWNVLRGEMSLVGPRPEALRIVERHFTLEQRGVLAVRPGLTCTGTLFFYLRLEHLEPPAGVGPEEFYVRELLEPKIDGDLHYVRHRNLAYDLRLLAGTARVVAFKSLGLEPRWSPPGDWSP